MIGTSRHTSRRETTRGVTRAETPSTPRMLMMLLPTTLPRAMLPWPRRTAPRDTASSGALVPQATTVRPITSEERPKRRATAADPFTRA